MGLKKQKGDRITETPVLSHEAESAETCGLKMLGASEKGKTEKVWEAAPGATAVSLYPIKDRFYGSLRPANRSSVSLAPHP